MIDRVTFDGAEYGGLVLLGWELVPAPPKTNYIDIVGASGIADATDLLTGHTPHGNQNLLLKFAVPWTQIDEWTQPGVRSRSQEGLFFSNVHGKRCVLRFDSKPGLSIEGRATVTRYSDFGTMRRMDVSVDADPYWLEDEPISESFQIDTNNQITSENIRAVYQSNSEATWSFDENSIPPAIVVRNSAPGDLLELEVFNLDPSKTYLFSMALPTSLSARYKIYANGTEIDADNISGITSFIIRIEIIRSEYAYAFANPTLTISGGESHAFYNLDKPAEIEYHANRDCTVIVDGERFDIKAGRGVIPGVLLMPNTQTVVSVFGDMNGTCELSYRRGVLIYTL